jgi:hypothetical protein
VQWCNGAKEEKAYRHKGATGIKKELGEVCNFAGNGYGLRPRFKLSEVANFA